MSSSLVIVGVEVTVTDLGFRSDAKDSSRLIFSGFPMLKMLSSEGNRGEGGESRLGDEGGSTRGEGVKAGGDEEARPRRDEEANTSRDSLASGQSDSEINTFQQISIDINTRQESLRNEGKGQKRVRTSGVRKYYK